MERRLYTSELEVVKSVSSLYFKFDGAIIYFTIKCDTIFGYDEKYYIAKYDIVDGLGNITDKKYGIKEYTSLKRLFNACIKFTEKFGCDLFFDYKIIEEYKNNYILPTEDKITNTKEIEIVKEKVNTNIKSMENNTNDKQTYKEQLENKIQDLKDRLKNIIISGDNLYKCILEHNDYGKSPDKQSYEYKELHKVLDKFEKIEDNLKADIRKLSSELANINNTNLKECYTAKYKIVYNDSRIIYSDTFNKNDLSIKRVSTLITNNNTWYHEVNVLKNTDNNTIKINEYIGNTLIKSKEYLQDRKTLVYEEIMRTKDNFTCYYVGMNKKYIISFFTASIPLTIIEVDEYNTVRSYHWCGKTIVNNITKEAKEKIKTLHYKYRNDKDIKKYLDKVINEF